MILISDTYNLWASMEVLFIRKIDSRCSLNQSFLDKNHCENVQMLAKSQTELNIAFFK